MKKYPTYMSGHVCVVTLNQQCCDLEDDDAHDLY